MAVFTFLKEHCLACTQHKEQGGHFILVVPSLNLVIVNRFDNEPQSRDAKGMLEAAQGPAINNDQFGHLVKLILDARISP